MSAFARKAWGSIFNLWNSWCKEEMASWKSSSDLYTHPWHCAAHTHTNNNSKQKFKNTFPVIICLNSSAGIKITWKAIRPSEASQQLPTLCLGLDQGVVMNGTKLTSFRAHCPWEQMLLLLLFPDVDNGTQGVEGCFVDTGGRAGGSQLRCVLLAPLLR